MLKIKNSRFITGLESKFLAIVLLATLIICIFMLSKQVLAGDLGVRGQTYKIAEEDPVAHIMRKLSAMEKSGELAEHKQILQKKTKETLLRPTAVKSITKATENNIFYYDPTFTLKEDIKDHLGITIHKAGKSFNPLDTVPMRSNLVFIDGDDNEQVEYALEQDKRSSGAVKIVLTNGSPIELEKQQDIPIYFDQMGLLTTKLNITKVPSIVSQEGNQLKIQEIKLEEKK